ncbi:MAG: hypothetical protein AAB668_00435 [Patescibacteria group bacterium]
MQTLIDMTRERNNRWTWAAYSIVALVYAFVFFREASLGLLANDAAKYALNIPYPHPPLGRWFMLASQALFGTTAFAARLPSFIAELVAIFLFLRCSRNFASFLLALGPAFLIWVGQGYQTSFLMLAISLIAFGVMNKGVARLAWVTAGYLLVIWTQLQGVLLLPAVLILFWEEWRNESLAFQFDRVPAWLLANVFAHTFLVALWFIGSPLAVADALALAGSSVGFAQKAAGFAGADFFPLALLLVALNIAHLIRWWKEKRLTASTGAMLVSSVILLAYLFSNHASYYLPYLFALCFWSLVELRFMSKRRMIALCIALAIFLGAEAYLFGPRLVQAPADRRAETVALREALSSHESVMALGFYGYEQPYLFGKMFARFASDLGIRERTDAVVVFRDETLNEEERAFLDAFPDRQTFGASTLYTR